MERSPDYPATYTDAWGGHIDWSGMTCVVRCLVCGRQWGTWFSRQEGIDALYTHRRLAHTLPPKHQKLTYDLEPYNKRTCTNCGDTSVYSKGLCHSCRDKAKKLWTQGLTFETAHLWVKGGPEPFKPREKKPIVHGTRQGYLNHSCRCEPCKEANKVYIKARKKKAS